LTYPLDHVYTGSGFTQNGLAGQTLGARKLVYLDVNGRWSLADADSSTTMPVLGLTVGAISNGKRGLILLWGFIGYEDWSWTAGEDIYASTVAGELTHTAPVGVGDVVQSIAVAVSDDLILFQGSAAGGGSTISNILEGETAFVGFDETKSHFVNYWYCDGTADDVQINAAQAYVVGLGGGSVMLERGTFNTTSPIIPTGNNVWFKGQDNGTFINGDGLASGEHGFHITGRDDIRISDLRIQTADGGQSTCHCIFIEDGSDRFIIENVTISDSDSDGIHVEGSAILDGRIQDCEILDVDDNGICFAMDGGADNATNIQINHNHIHSAGSNGILLSVFKNGEVINNFIEDSTGDGLELLADCDENKIKNNFINDNGAYGIKITDATSLRNRVTDNQLLSNTTAAAYNAGTDTKLRSVQFYCSEADDEHGTVPGKSITVGQTAYVGFHVPTEVQQIMKANMYVIPDATKAAANWDLVADYGASGEAYNAHSDSDAASTYNVTQNQFFEIDIVAKGLLANALPHDTGGVTLTVSTAGDDVTLVFLELYYV